MKRIDFVDWTFPRTPRTLMLSILLLKESCPAIRTLKFDPPAPVVPIECLRFQTAPSPAKVHLRRLGVRLIRSVSAGVFAILAMGGITGGPNSVHAQGAAGGEFRLSQSVHWGNTVLPTGRFSYSVESGVAPTVVRVSQIGGSFTGSFLPQTLSEGSDFNPAGIVVARIGEEMFVTSLRLKERGLVLNFSAPNAEMNPPPPDRTPARQITISKSPTQGFFTFLNLGSEKVSYGEIEKVYLAVCEAIEREYSRSTPIRPRLILHLGASQNLLRYSDREVRLTKWDRYRFADAVVDIALREMISPEDKLRLSNLAVAQASATVSLCELKNCKD
jgi:hypothetical protein